MRAGGNAMDDRRPTDTWIKVLCATSAGRRSLATKSERRTSIVKVRRTILLPDDSRP